MRRAIPLVALVLAACQPAAAPPSAGQDEFAGPDEVLVRVGPIVTAEELEGIYRVADIEGIDMIDLDRGFSVVITRNKIDVLENCISAHWTYRFENERLVTETIRRPSCRGALKPEEAALMDGFTRAERVSRTPSNGILFEGGGPAITLFTQ